MARLVIVSNRLPVTVNRTDGDLHYHPSAGGLATGLNSLDDTFDTVWIGWPGQEIDNEWEREAIRNDLAKDQLVPVFLTADDINDYYEGFSNKTIWPHFHYFTQYTTYRDRYWDAYVRVNQLFFDAVASELRPDDLVWVHDYQLMLLPGLIRRAFPSISIGFFLHIPFPSYEIFRTLPWRRDIMDGLLGADQLGFHTYDYMRHFLSAAYRIAGREHQFGRLLVNNRLVNVDVFPMGIDYQKYAAPPEDSDAQGAIDIRNLAENRKIIVSIDRLDYTKGIPERLHAFTLFLKRHPEYHRRVTLVMLVVPSRANVDQYQGLKAEVDTLVGHINSKYGTFDWMPIQYYYRSLRFSELMTLYRESAIALITPLRDGMNLVAKEYIASKEDSQQGVVILSEMAGARNELMEALIVNPHDKNEIVAALVEAIEMPAAEQQRRLAAMQQTLRTYNVRQWAANFVNEQKKLMERSRMQQAIVLADQEQQQLLTDYRQSSNRLIILDYDGTLMDFHVDPQAVAPDEEVLATLAQLVSDPANHVVVNSGRDRPTLQRWLGHLAVDLAAEHGVWLRRGDDWKLNSNVTDSWKDEVRQLLQNLVNRTPGSFIEEKDYSLAWHYRGIDRDLGEKRIREFRDMLLYIIHNKDLQVLEGNKVVEIKNAGVNKGKATQQWVGRADWDFVLGIGDDHTDEDIFRALPDTGYSIKVGSQRTVARYSLPNVSAVRQLLRALIGEQRG